MPDGAVSWLALVLARQGAGEEGGRGDHRLTGRYACYRVYACKDGGYYSVGALEPKFWTALCNAVDVPDLIEIQFAAGDDGARAHQAMEAVFLSRTRSEWERDLAGLEVCCEPVLDLGEIASHQQIAARGLVVNTAAGVEVRPAVPMRADWRRRDAPGLGEHTGEILSEVGVDAALLASLEKDGVVSRASCLQTAFTWASAHRGGGRRARRAATDRCGRRRRRRHRIRARPRRNRGCRAHRPHASPRPHRRPRRPAGASSPPRWTFPTRRLRSIPRASLRICPQWGTRRSSTRSSSAPGQQGRPPRTPWRRQGCRWFCSSAGPSLGRRT